MTIVDTVELVLKDHDIGHKNTVSRGRRSFVAYSVALTCVTFCQGICGPFKTYGLSWQWSIKTGFTVLVTFWNLEPSIPVYYN